MKSNNTACLLSYSRGNVGAEPHPWLQFMNDEEEVFYANYGLIDICEDCGNDTPILNHHDGKNYLTWTGKHLYCLKCLKYESVPTK